MCEAITVWMMNGEEERRRCNEGGDLCFYHRKMRNGLVGPLEPQDTGPYVNRPIRVEWRGRDIWTR